MGKLNRNNGKLSTKKKILFSVSINIAFFAICSLLFKLNYEMLDEMIFSELLADNCAAIGNFSNYYLFYGIKLLQQLIYPLNAYAWTALILALASMITISYILYDKFSVTAATLFTILFNGFVGINHYVTISFTRLPALLCVAGLLCIIHTIYHKRWHGGYLWGAFLVILSSMYRNRIFLVGAAILVVFLIVDTVSEKFALNEKHVIADSLKALFEPKRLLAGVLVFAVCMGLNVFGRSAMNQIDGMQYFAEYTSARSAVWDFSIPTYDECAEEYDAIGIDKNDLLMLKGHFMDDKGAFTLEKLQAIREIKERHSQHRTIVDILKAIVKGEASEVRHMTSKVILYASVFGVLLVYLLLMKRKNYLTPAALLLTAAALYVYLYFDGRVPYRVVYGIWLPIMVYLVYGLSEDRIRPKALDLLQRKMFKKKSVMALLLVGSLLISGAFLVANDYRNFKNDYAYMQSVRADVNEYVKAHPDDRFELCRSANLFEGNIDNKTNYVINNEGRYKNSHIFNGTYYRLPYYDEFNKDVFGTDNLFENLLNDRVYFIDENQYYTTAMEKYLEKYYTGGKDVTFEIVDTIGKYAVVSYSLAD